MSPLLSLLKMIFGASSIPSKTNMIQHAALKKLNKVLPWKGLHSMQEKINKYIGYKITVGCGWCWEETNESSVRG